jgi:hypothetical protein
VSPGALSRIDRVAGDQNIAAEWSATTGDATQRILSDWCGRVCGGLMMNHETFQAEYRKP